MPKRAVLLVNTKSRRGTEWFEAARQALQEGGLELVRAEAFTNPRNISPAVQQAVKSEIPLVVLGGGDGTFSANVRHFVGSDSVLGVLPLGTGNAFARDLGITAAVADACDVILNGRELEVDLGVAGNDYFVNVVTVGLTTRIAEELTNDSKKRLGRLVYAIALFKALRRVKPFRCVISTDTEKHELETMQVVIGSGRYHAGPFPIAPDAEITDGRLNIYALASTSRWSLLRLALNMPGGHHVEMQEVPSWAATGGLLEASPNQGVNIDGELVARTPLKFSVAPKAIKVMAPQDFDPENP